VHILCVCIVYVFNHTIEVPAANSYAASHFGCREREDQCFHNFVDHVLELAGGSQDAGFSQPGWMCFVGLFVIVDGLVCAQSSF